jgi:hypothetical protein
MINHIRIISPPLCKLNNYMTFSRHDGMDDTCKKVNE